MPLAGRQPHHLAFPGVLNGGICGALLDCHSNWTAAWHLMRKSGAAAPPCTVTAEFDVKLKRPTPLDAELTIRAKVVESGDDRAVVEADDRGRREGDRDVPGHLRRGEGRPPRVPPLVGDRFSC